MVVGKQASMVADGDGAAGCALQVQAQWSETAAATVEIDGGG